MGFLIEHIIDESSKHLKIEHILNNGVFWFIPYVNIDAYYKGKEGIKLKKNLKK